MGPAKTLKVFTTNYHISVNPTLVADLSAIGLEVLMPDKGFAKDRIDFYAPNDEHVNVPGVVLVGDYKKFIEMEEPIAILIPCIQLVEDFMRIYEHRGKKDVLVFLTANSDCYKIFPIDGSDYIMTHDIDFHRATPAKYKIMYFSRPLLVRAKKTEDELKRSFEAKRLKLFINNFDQEGFEPEYADALKLRELYYEATGWRIPFFGYGMQDGWLSQEKTQDNMVDSMFSVVFKRRETWGQMVNESMLLGTPCIFLQQYIYSTFKHYEINQETAIVKTNVEDIVDQVLNMTYPEYETLVNESYSQSQMFCNDQNRQEKLSWLFDKVSKDEKMQ